MTSALKGAENASTPEAIISITSYYISAPISDCFTTDLPSIYFLSSAKVGSALSVCSISNLSISY